MAHVLENEALSAEELMGNIARGAVALPANKHHKCLKGIGVGQGLKTKINVNLGVSRDVCCFDREMNKARMAVEFKAHAVMDLSVFGDTEAFRKRLVNEIPLMIGTVPIYDTLIRTKKRWKRSPWRTGLKLWRSMPETASILSPSTPDSTGPAPGESKKPPAVRHCQPGGLHPL